MLTDKSDLRPSIKVDLDDLDLFLAPQTQSGVAQSLIPDPDASQDCCTVNRSLVPGVWPSGSGRMVLKVRLMRGPRSWYSFATWCWMKHKESLLVIRHCEDLFDGSGSPASHPAWTRTSAAASRGSAEPGSAPRK